MRKTIFFKSLPVQIEMRAPIPDGKGQTIAYSNMAMVVGSVELAVPVGIEVEIPGEGEKGEYQIEAVMDALTRYAIMARRVITDQFLGWVDEVEGLMKDRMELRL